MQRDTIKIIYCTFFIASQIKLMSLEEVHVTTTSVYYKDNIKDTLNYEKVVLKKPTDFLRIIQFHLCFILL